MSLIEILVTIVVISFGLLSVVGLEITGVKNNYSAYRRTTATILAYDMLDRMRANRAQVKNGDYSTGSTYTAVTVKPSGCSGMCDTDMTAWLADIANRLPSGKGAIQAEKPTSATDMTITVTVEWNDSNSTSGGSAQKLSVEAQGCNFDAFCNF